jgi:hypothetical protein
MFHDQCAELKKTLWHQYNDRYLYLADNEMTIRRANLYFLEKLHESLGGKVACYYKHIDSAFHHLDVKQQIFMLTNY